MNDRNKENAPPGPPQEHARRTRLFHRAPALTNIPVNVPPPRVPARQMIHNDGRLWSDNPDEDEEEEEDESEQYIVAKIFYNSPTGDRWSRSCWRRHHGDPHVSASNPFINHFHRRCVCACHLDCPNACHQTHEACERAMAAGGGFVVLQNWPSRAEESHREQMAKAEESQMARWIDRGPPAEDEVEETDASTDGADSPQTITSHYQLTVPEMLENGIIVMGHRPGADLGALEYIDRSLEQHLRDRGLAGEQDEEDKEADDASARRSFLRRLVHALSQMLRRSGAEESDEPSRRSRWRFWQRSSRARGASRSSRSSRSSRH